MPDNDCLEKIWINLSFVQLVYINRILPRKNIKQNKIQIFLHWINDEFFLPPKNSCSIISKHKSQSKQK